MGLGWVLAVAVGGGTLAGVYVDRWLGTGPWLTLLGILLGMTAGFVSVFRTVLGSAPKAPSGGSRPAVRVLEEEERGVGSNRADRRKDP
ncbi:MAG: AtpZ/AtpI family protein [Acidobacteriota bacterium]